MIAIALIIPAKVFANDHKEPPTTNQITSFAVGATIVDVGFGIVSYMLFDYSPTKDPGFIALYIFFGIIISYLIAYWIFGTSARKFAKLLKEKEGNNRETPEP
ncbi:MAG: ABZJ_00895 family protein [Helicobacteraceae bacterium]|jgi:uncharacterized membrane protein YraQ (UPF0718 family)|nr:ABZJ_00895 family protein [Helicobacteraceae bacterium]